MHLKGLCNTYLLDASQRSWDGVWLNMSVREVKCKVLWAVLRTGYCTFISVGILEKLNYTSDPPCRHNPTTWTLYTHLIMVHVDWSRVGWSFMYDTSILDAWIKQLMLTFSKPLLSLFITVFSEPSELIFKCLQILCN